MTDFLAEYIRYYEVRMQRYENNPDFPDSYTSEKAIYEAIAGCKELGEFKDRLGNLNELNAVALTKDQNRMRLKHFEELKEDIRALGPRRILQKADDFPNVMDLITMVNEEEVNNMKEITADTVCPFDDWTLLEQEEVYATADVPSSYKSKYQKIADDLKKDIRDRFKSQHEEMQNWIPGWKFNFGLIKEPRHRRFYPVPDSVVDQRILQYKSILNLK